MVALTAVPTVRGAYRAVGNLLSGPWPASWNWYLASSSPTLDKTTVTLASATLVTSANVLAASSVGFPTHNWFDGVAQVGSFTGGYVQTPTLLVTAGGTQITWRYWLIADDNVTEANREVYFIADAGADQTIPATRTHHFDVEIRHVV